MTTHRPKIFGDVLKTHKQLFPEKIGEVVGRQRLLLPEIRKRDALKNVLAAMESTTNLLERLFAAAVGNDPIEGCFPRSVDDQPFDAIGR